MHHQLRFSQRYQYPSLSDGIILKATLRYGAHEVLTKAEVDTGAGVCLFSREVGEELGLDIEAGLPKSLSTLTGSLQAYGHEVTLITLDVNLETLIYFAKDYDLPRNLLGREGWLRLVRLAIIDYDEELYLSHYNDSL